MQWVPPVSLRCSHAISIYPANHRASKVNSTVPESCFLASHENCGHDQDLNGEFHHIIVWNACTAAYVYSSEDAEYGIIRRAPDLPVRFWLIDRCPAPALACFPVVCHVVHSFRHAMSSQRLLKTTTNAVECSCSSKRSTVAVCPNQAPPHPISSEV